MNLPEVAPGERNESADNLGGDSGNINNGDTTTTQGESSEQTGNNSGGGIEGSGNQSESQQHNESQGESSTPNLPRRTVWSRDHPFELIIGDPEAGVTTRRRANQHECNFLAFLSEKEPKEVEEALTDPDWVIAMQEELNQFKQDRKSVV